MKNNSFDANQQIHKIAQGSAFNKTDSAGQAPAFTRMVILDVVADPEIIDDTKVAYWEHTLKVKNIKYARVLPRNSIIAMRILDGNSTAAELPMFLFPFFPSHLALPCKAGEHIWVMFEHPDARYSEMGYWLHKIVEPHMGDDVNHTHPGRQYDPSFVSSTRDHFNGGKKPVYEFRNGIVDESNGERYVVGGSAFISGEENFYEKLVQETDSAKMEQYESVPRVKKRPGDLALEGSNNTSIVLGTDRSGAVTAYKATDEKGKVPKPTDDITGHAGSIDIVAGRRQTP